MIFTENDINDSFYDWIQIVLPGIDVQRLEDNGPRPDLPYISYRIMGFNQVGPFERLRPDDTGFATVRGNINIPLYIQGHGDNALTRLQELQRSVYDEDVITHFASSVCMGFASILSDPNTIPVLRDTKYENRASLDLLFRTHDSFTTNTGVIETVEYELTLTDGVNESTEDITIEL